MKFGKLKTLKENCRKRICTKVYLADDEIDEIHIRLAMSDTEKQTFDTKRGQYIRRYEAIKAWINITDSYDHLHDFNPTNNEHWKRIANVWSSPEDQIPRGG